VTTSLRFATYLSPRLGIFYRAVADHLARELGLDVEFAIGGSCANFDAERDDVSFLCGLPYVDLRDAGVAIEPIAAPVLSGNRFGGRPVYFSDVIVRTDSPFRSFADLRGRSWAFNEVPSQSGYGVTRARLAELGETAGYFGRVVESGAHHRSIRMVADGSVDASAIDCQVLAVELRDHPELGDRLRVIDSLGPSTIQPVVAAERLPAGLRHDVAESLLRMGSDPTERESLGFGFVDRLVRVDDGDYDDIRRMSAAARAAGLQGFGPAISF